MPNIYQTDMVVRLQAENNKLYNENKFLRQDIERMSRHPQLCYRNNRPCCRCCEPKYYAKTPTQQEIIDLIKTTSTNIKDVQEKLLKQFND